MCIAVLRHDPMMVCASRHLRQVRDRQYLPIHTKLAQLMPDGSYRIICVQGVAQP